MGDNRGERVGCRSDTDSREGSSRRASAHTRFLPTSSRSSPRTDVERVRKKGHEERRAWKPSGKSCVGRDTTVSSERQRKYERVQTHSSPRDRQPARFRDPHKGKRTRRHTHPRRRVRQASRSSSETDSRSLSQPTICRRRASDVPPDRSRQLKPQHRLTEQNTLDKKESESREKSALPRIARNEKSAWLEAQEIRSMEVGNWGHSRNKENISRKKLRGRITQ